MKTTTYLMLMLTLAFAAFSEDYVWKGMKVSGKVVSVQPATVKLALSDGSVKTYNVHDFGLDSAAKFSIPQNPYASVLSLADKTQTLVDNSRELAGVLQGQMDSIIAVQKFINSEIELGRMTKTQGTAIFRMLTPNSPNTKKAETVDLKMGVPAEVFAKIKAKVVQDHPDDYVVQKYMIDMQVDSYKKLESPQGAN